MTTVVEREEWEREDHEPTSSKQKRDEGEQRNRSAMEAAIQRVKEKARANGTYRGGDTVVRRVDPESIRPPGWSPIVKLQKGHTHEERCRAMVNALERRPLPRAKLRQLLGLDTNQMDRALRDLERDGVVYRGEVAETVGGPPSVMLHLSEDPESRNPEIPEPEESAVADTSETEIVIRLDKPAPWDKRVEAIAELLTLGPRRQSEVRAMLAMHSSDFGKLIAPALEAGRFALSPAPRRAEGGNPGKLLHLPGDDRTEPSHDGRIEFVQITRTCALDGCDETFEPTAVHQIYHSSRCHDRSKRDDLPLTEERTCKLDGCDETFVPTTPAQQYHSSECRDEANRRINRDSSARARRAKAPTEAPTEAPTNGVVDEDTIRGHLEQLLAEADAERTRLYEEAESLRREAEAADRELVAAEGRCSRLRAAHEALAPSGAAADA